MCCYRTIQGRDIQREELSVYSVTDMGDDRDDTSRQSQGWGGLSRIFTSFAKIRQSDTISRDSAVRGSKFDLKSQNSFMSFASKKKNSNGLLSLPSTHKGTRTTGAFGGTLNTVFSRSNSENFDGSRKGSAVKPNNLNNSK